MSAALKSHVRDGHLAVVLEEPTDLPEGAEVPDPWMDALDEEARADLQRAIEEGEEDVRAGRVVSDEEAWQRLLRAASEAPR